MSDHPTSIDAEGVFEPFHVGRVPSEEFSRGERYGMCFQHLSSFGGGTQISVSMEILAPGRQANQAHYHLLEEEHVFVLEGRMTLRLGDRNFELSAEHYVCFPAGQRAAHALFNHTDASCRYLVFGNPQPHDVAVFPESDRVSVKLIGESYRKSATLNYWDHVDVGARE